MKKLFLALLAAALLGGNLASAGGHAFSMTADEPIVKDEPPPPPPSPAAKAGCGPGGC